MKKKEEKFHTDNIVWGAYDEMVKNDKSKRLINDWRVFEDINKRYERRINKLNFLYIVWWTIVGLGLVISLAHTLYDLHDLLFPLGGGKDSTLSGIVAMLFVFYFMFTIGSIAALLPLKGKVNEKYRQEVYSFFNRRYENAKRKFKTWQITEIKHYISILDKLNLDPYLENAGLMDEVWETKDYYKELLKELERDDGIITNKQ